MTLQRSPATIVLCSQSDFKVLREIGSAPCLKHNGDLPVNFHFELGEHSKNGGEFQEIGSSEGAETHLASRKKVWKGREFFC